MFLPDPSETNVIRVGAFQRQAMVFDAGAATHGDFSDRVGKVLLIGGAGVGFRYC